MFLVLRSEEVLPACPTPARPAGSTRPNGAQPTSWRTNAVRSAQIGAREAATMATMSATGSGGGRAAGTRRATARATAAAALALALAGAGGADPPVRLTVTFSRAPGARHVAHLRCTGARASADGFLRDAGAARSCARARRIVELLANPPDPARACTQIYGGPERARVTGRIGARRVARTFTRADGCGISDWNRARPLLPRPG